MPTPFLRPYRSPIVIPSCCHLSISGMTVPFRHEIVPGASSFMLVSPWPLTTRLDRIDGAS